jgi:peptidoglycan/LPS O-acetylase OafA/YrhL
MSRTVAASQDPSRRLPRRAPDYGDSAHLPLRIDSLTSLRFFAAFAVFTHHFTGLGGMTGYARSPLIYPYSKMGAQGVSFFFVLSGFLLTWVFKPREHPCSFYWRRVGRIWPAHLVATIPAIWAYYVLAHVQINWTGLIASVFLVQTWIPHVQPTLPGNQVTWTLSVEVFFYFLLPFIAPIAWRLRTRYLALATSIGFLYLIAGNWRTAVAPNALATIVLARQPVLYVPEFLLGMTLAVALKRGFRLPIRPEIPVVAFLCYDVLFYKLPAHIDAHATQALQYTETTVISLLAGGMIVACVQREISGHRGLLNTTPMIMLGAWSYSFYLLHHTIDRFALYEIGRGRDNNSALFTLLGMGLVVVLFSWLLYAYVEAPAERWMRGHIPDRWRGDRGARGQPATDVVELPDTIPDEAAAPTGLPAAAEAVDPPTRDTVRFEPPANP